MLVFCAWDIDYRVIDKVYVQNVLTAGNRPDRIYVHTVQVQVREHAHFTVHIHTYGIV